MDSTPKRALVATLVIAAAVTAVFAPREVISEIFMFFASFSVIWFVLFILLRSQVAKAWPPGKRHLAIWLVAAGAGALLGLLPRVLSALTR
jgi:hypothetical protein